MPLVGVPFVLQLEHQSPVSHMAKLPVLPALHLCQGVEHVSVMEDVRWNGHLLCDALFPRCGYITHGLVGQGSGFLDGLVALRADVNVGR